MSEGMEQNYELLDDLVKAIRSNPLIPLHEISGYGVRVGYHPHTEESIGGILITLYPPVTDEMLTFLRSNKLADALEEITAIQNSTGMQERYKKKWGL